MDDQDRKHDATRQKTEDAWWRPGVQVFGEVTGWIVVPIVAALYGGQYLDERLRTGSLYFLLLTGIAFIISCVGIVLVGVRYMKEMDLSTKNNKHNENERRGSKKS